MNEINIDTSKNNYFYDKDPFNDFVGKNKIFGESVCLKQKLCQKN